VFAPDCCVLVRFLALGRAPVVTSFAELIAIPSHLLALASFIGWFLLLVALLLACVMDTFHFVVEDKREYMCDSAAR
jgi:hypothetical protein